MTEKKCRRGSAAGSMEIRHDPRLYFRFYAFFESSGTERAAEDPPVTFRRRPINRLIRFRISMTRNRRSSPGSLFSSQPPWVPPRRQDNLLLVNQHDRSCELEIQMRVDAEAPLKGDPNSA
jgi:hypothetical protein